MRVTLVHNPDAGEGRPQGRDLVKILEGAGLQVRYVTTENNWKNALDEPADFAVAAGGDGTVAKVLLAMLEREKPVALLPLGTANNIARTLGVVGDARALAAAWRVAAVRPFDVGRLRAPWGDERLVESFGGGVFAETILRGDKELDDPTAIVGPESDQAMLLLREIVHAAQPRPWRIELDGQDLSGEYLAVEALNIRFVGPNVPLAPEADPADGQLELVLIGEEHREALLEHLSGRLKQAAAGPPGLPVKRGRRLTVVLEQPFPPLHVDDDIVGRDVGGLEGEAARFVLELEPGAVQLLGADAHVAREP